jgi:hypothetical protein
LNSSPSARLSAFVSAQYPAVRTLKTGHFCQLGAQIELAYSTAAGGGVETAKPETAAAKVDGAGVPDVAHGVARQHAGQEFDVIAVWMTEDHVVDALQLRHDRTQIHGEAIGFACGKVVIGARVVDHREIASLKKQSQPGSDVRDVYHQAGGIGGRSDSRGFAAGRSSVGAGAVSCRSGTPVPLGVRAGAAGLAAHTAMATKSEQPRILCLRMTAQEYVARSPLRQEDIACTGSSTRGDCTTGPKRVEERSPPRESGSCQSIHVIFSIRQPSSYFLNAARPCRGSLLS